MIKVEVLVRQKRKNHISILEIFSFSHLLPERRNGANLRGQANYLLIKRHSCSDALQAHLCYKCTLENDFHFVQQ
jgi:hypothetical protein